MKAITVRQPWAWAIMQAGKNVENRSRNIVGSYRGPLVIHAAQRLDPDALNECAARSGHSVSSLIGTLLYNPMGEQGAALGIVDLIDSHESWECASLEECPDHARHCSRWAEGNGRHLVLSNPRPFAEPIPYKGRLGLWEFPDDLLPEVSS